MYNNNANNTNNTNTFGIKKTLRRTIGKAVCLVTRLDAALACDTDQLYAVFSQALRELFMQ